MQHLPQWKLTQKQKWDKDCREEICGPGHQELEKTLEEQWPFFWVWKDLLYLFPILSLYQSYLTIVCSNYMSFPCLDFRSGFSYMINRQTRGYKTDTIFIVGIFLRTLSMIYVFPLVRVILEILSKKSMPSGNVPALYGPVYLAFTDAPNT